MQISLSRESVLETLLSISEGAVVYFDLDGTILMWNAASERLYGFAESDALGKHMALILPAYDVFPMEEILRNAREIENGAWENAERLDKDGRRIPLRIRRAAVRAHTGELLGVVERAMACSSGETEGRADGCIAASVRQNVRQATTSANARSQNAQPRSETVQE